MKRVLRIMVDILQPEGIDWMNFGLSRDNPYTYHHIVEKSKGGDKSIDNGAILTRKAHSFLHMLENICPEAYQDLQDVFVKINGAWENIKNADISDVWNGDVPQPQINQFGKAKTIVSESIYNIITNAEEVTS